MDQEEIGRLIRLARQEKGWNQQQLADAYGCSQQNISDIERGNISLNLGDLERMARLVDKDLYYFFPVEQSRLDEAQKVVRELAALPEGRIREEAMRLIRVIAQDARRRALEEQQQRTKAEVGGA
ncbi:MAG: helix-turn-helix transcriptional regulator [Anaerolineae bacterium]|jgi:transcriptional regulator with XRE-family HTH domain|nr:helix-turn-helix transcriptional regulator [Anaerolineae bacterium]